MENKSLIILDLETTRNSAINEEEIIEIACIKISERFEVLDEFHTLVKPSCPLSYITKVKTGINERDLYNKPKINESLISLLEFIKEEIVIAHNAKFDYKVLKQNCKNHNFILNNNFIDSLSLLRNIFPNEKCSLISLKDKFNINKSHHRALDDVYALKEILFLSNKYYVKKFGNSILDSLDEFKIINLNAQTTLNI
ncbi:MAG: polymerase III PolC-type protein [Berkelbacteria bacterium GW2011_GWA1_36_9]|uniref:Polymerase III PolC-type protein n=1 Tax=Berkelbacteria bacterium GW2011_GWA1_36_9 TaxID=1618331 RepID=A0A0G0I0R8_9BACT|nr:MAG: polymerase III PolC-type protein [Berkelbacteria bacterium GW2011_GWA1_36_9]